MAGGTMGVASLVEDEILGRAAAGHVVCCVPLATSRLRTSPIGTLRLTTTH